MPGRLPSHADSIEKNRNSALTEIATQLFIVFPHQKEALEELLE
jgi:hypothetical protein